MGPSQDIFSLVYQSTAAVQFSTQNLIDLLNKARQVNSSLGVSGMLLFKEGNFLQVLEGDQEAIVKLYAKIGTDFRHRNVITLSQSTLKERDFPDWSMGFHDLGIANASRPAGFSAFLETQLTAADFSIDPGRAKKLLLLFKDEKRAGKARSAG